ncbi:thiol reductant ABC exporter subunit CydC [Streptomyces sp. 891-h]|uniref:thiol reductant ABC exporter subunit CydC n=1 Tax=Streptomyces sp. 891-h TaxID=2720714 RepID=UPI001FA96FCA|nr:thiol reductant ABC exporter subunit CydC [Streptomyces sp. 891-h]UNZ16124.1 thiol reductant ABC exporter subunit CydC [Streptomyces sp. 891-h]
MLSRSWNRSGSHLLPGRAPLPGRGLFPGFGRGHTARLLRLLLPHRRRLLAAVTAAVAAELSALALMTTAAWLISSAARQPPLEAVALAIVMVRALALGRGVLRYVERLLGHDAVLTAMAALRARLYERMIPLAPAALPAFRRADLLSRLVVDIEAVQDLLLRCLIPAAVALTVAATAGSAAFALLPAAGAVLTAGLAITAVLLPLAVRVAVRRSGGRAAALQGELAASALDLTEGAADLAAFGAGSGALRRTSLLGRRLGSAQLRPAIVTAAATAAGLVVQGLTTAAVTVLGLRAHAQGELPTVLLPVLAVLALASFEVTAPLVATARASVEVAGSAARLGRLWETAPPVAEPARPLPAPRAPVRVEVAGLGVRHRPDRPPALEDVGLVLAPGERVALVGPSGSGKSTLLSTLLRFCEYQWGSVRLDGHELRDLSGRDVRQLVTGVTQDAHVFRASVRENIALGRPEATDRRLRAVAAQVRLLPWIESLPQGWETPVAEGGDSLSGGQRQRLLLARALLADPAVLVLDEPTEGLDPQTADDVLADLLRAADGRTTLLVTHRAAGLRLVDRVVRLSRGRVDGGGAVSRAGRR